MLDCKASSVPPLSRLPQVAQKPGISHFAHGLAQLAASVGGAQASERQIAGAAALAELLAAQVLQVLNLTNSNDAKPRMVAICQVQVFQRWVFE
jgi:hypothetical protein